MTERTGSSEADWISPAEAASLACVTVRTMQRYGDAGRVACMRLPSGHRRYSRESVQALLAPAS